MLHLLLAVLPVEEDRVGIVERVLLEEQLLTCKHTVRFLRQWVWHHSVSFRGS